MREQVGKTEKEQRKAKKAKEESVIENKRKKMKFTEKSEVEKRSNGREAMES